MSVNSIALLGDPECSNVSGLRPDNWQTSHSPTVSLQARFERSTISMLGGRSGNVRGGGFTGKDMVCPNLDTVNRSRDAGFAMATYR